MTTIYIPHEVNTLAEVDALALRDRQQNGAIVICDGEIARLFLPYATRNERAAEWSVEDGRLFDGDKVTVLVPVEAEEEERVVKTSDGRWHFGNGHFARYVTAWEEA